MIGHTLDIVGRSIIVCGGLWSTNSCFRLTDHVSWEMFYTTVHHRYQHFSWAPGNGHLYLIGGQSSPQTTEFVPVEEGSVGGETFLLQHEVHIACAISTLTHIFIPGGVVNTIVRRYVDTGEMTELPKLNQGRRYHGCGRFTHGNTELRCRC